MKPVHLLLFCFFQSASLSLLSQALDISFSGNGKNVATIGTASNGRAMIIQPADQKILIAGSYNDGTNTSFAAVRFLPSGALDPNFGVGGKATMPFGLNTSGAVGVGLQSDGKIILVGEFYLSQESRVTTLVRLTPTGQLDGSFSPTGYIEIAEPYQANTVLIQPDDKILVGGYGTGAFCVARYTKDGIPDPTWGSAGAASAPGDEVWGMAVQPDGGVVAMGFGIGSVSSMMAARFTKNGVLDKHFGTQGTTNILVNGRNSVQGFGMTLQADGYIVLVGHYVPDVANPKFRFLIVRLKPDGTLDPGFAGNGKLGVSFSGSDLNAYTAVQLSEGQIVVAGYEDPSSGNDKMAMCRVGVNGDLDFSFGTDGDGWVTTGWSNANAVAYSLALQKDGKIVAGGGLDGGGFAVARYLNPIIIPPPPFEDAVPASIQQTNNSALMAPAGLQVFPNPANSVLQIEGLNADGTVLMTVTNTAGGTMLTKAVNGQGHVSLDIHRLVPGMYFLELQTNSGRQSYPFVKLN